MTRKVEILFVRDLVLTIAAHTLIYSLIQTKWWDTGAQTENMQIVIMILEVIRALFCATIPRLYIN